MAHGPIAIVGMACRYPDALGKDELWQSVLGRRRAFRAVPRQRLSPDYLGGADDVDLASVTRLAVLRDWFFDRERFGIPGRLFRAVDATHWLALETAAEALADAGHPGGRDLSRDTVGVVLGNSLTGEFSRASMLRLRWPYIASMALSALRQADIEHTRATGVLEAMESLLKRPFPEPGDETLAGALSNTIAGRICNYFDFHGAGYTVDGACSSSLLAVVSSCRALVSGECDVMLAGGVDMSLDPFELVGFSRMGALAQGPMRVYDERPTGFLPGEGCGIVVLMRAEDARRQGRQPYAYLTGWGASTDGSGGLTRPEPTGQLLALRRAYGMAERDPTEVGLIEGHGTGTAVGDEAELTALAMLLGDGERSGTSRSTALGSGKANIGHTKAAAGAAGLIKVALATHYDVLPPTTGCDRPHEILRGSGALRVLDAPEPWLDRPPVAGVSSMGFGGINTHVVVEGAHVSPPTGVLPAAVRRWSAPTGADEIVLVGAPDPRALVQRLSALAELADQLSDAEIRDVALTAWRSGAATATCRAAIVAGAPRQLASAARHAADVDWDGTLRVDVDHGYTVASGPAARVGLLFPGQAAPVRRRLDPWADRLEVPALPTPPRPAGQLDDRIDLTETSIAQPAIVQQCLAGLAWLRSIDCRPVAALGHSLGELTALQWAGALSPADTLRLATSRGHVMSEHGVGGTAMASVGLGASEAADLASGTAAVVAADNSPAETVLAGPREDVAVVRERAARRGVPTTALPVSHGFHSPAMEPVRTPWRAVLDDVPLARLRLPVVSTVLADWVDVDPAGLRELLVEQLVRPVRFSAAVDLLSRRCDLMVEVGPGAVLSALARANGVAAAVSMDCGGSPRRHALATATLAAAGAADLDAWFSDRPGRILPLDSRLSFVPNPCEDRADGELPARRRVDHRGLASFSGVPRPSAAPGDGVAPAAAVDPSDDVRAPDRVPSAAMPVDARDAADALDATVSHLATVLELPTSSITPGSSLLDDLHLTSLQTVQMVETLALRLGRRPPGTPPRIAEATVEDVADFVGGLPELRGDRAGTIEGVRPWVRTFTTAWVPCPVPRERPGSSVRWHTVTGMDDLPDGLAARLVGPGPLPAPGLGAEDGLALGLGVEASPEQVVAVLSHVRSASPRRLLLVHHGNPAAAGLARSICAEVDDCAVTVVEVPPGRPLSDLDALTVHEHGQQPYREVRVDPRGSFEEAIVRPWTPGTGDVAVDAGDVCLVTGGIRGITAVAAAALATRSGCALVVVGRTPADHPAVSAALATIRQGVDVHYVVCDVTDPQQVHHAVVAAGRHGPVRALLHGAGINTPARLSEVTTHSLRASLAAKVQGLLTTLDALPDDPRLVVGFGSIIGRQGLAGQAEYCLANDWMRVELERWATSHPACVTRVLEWSVWDEVGMGVELSVLDSLRRRGIEPIDPRAGAQLMLDAVGDATGPVTVLATSRFAASATLRVQAPSGDALRFVERSLVHVPGVETVAEVELSVGDDPYVTDHVVDGTPILPAVVGLEAAAQAAALTGHRGDAWSFQGVGLHAPITLPADASRVLRIAALADGPRVDVVIRDDGDQFGSERVSVSVTSPPEPPPAPEPAVSPVASVAATRTPHPLYGSPLMFHGPALQRLVAVDHVSAFDVSAWIRADEHARWFSDFHDERLLLGDLGVHDAAIHVLLACLPHRRALPTRAERVSVWRRPAGLLRVLAQETSHAGEDHTFDVLLVGEDGATHAAWHGLGLRAVGTVSWPDGLPAQLVGPWVSRRLVECGIDASVDLVSSVDASPRVPVAWEGDDRLRHRMVTDGTGGIGLVARAASPVGLAVDAACEREPESLTATDREVARLLADGAGETCEISATRVAHVRALVGDQPLTLRRVDPDGVVVVRAGDVVVVSARPLVAELHHRITITIAVAAPDSG